jgi:thiol-disulfide isomerase/thioredoxin
MQRGPEVPPMTPASLAFALLSALAPRSEGPFQDLTLDQATAAAARDKKVVMIDFFTTWCGPCKKLDKKTWTDPEVQKWLGEHVVALKMDAEREVELAKKHRIDGYPTMLFLKADGTELDRIIGYKDPAEFLRIAADALAGKNEVSRAKEKLAGHENDPDSHQDYGDALREAGRYEEALAEYLWCFDNGRKAPGYAGVRLSFLLSKIKQLGTRYPQVIKALEDRRDAAEARLVAGADSFEDAQDSLALNRELGAGARSLELFDKLRKQKPLTRSLRIAFSNEVFPLLVDGQRYKDAVELFDDPEGYVTWKLKMVASMPGRETDEDKSAESFLRQMAIGECSKMYEALVGADLKDAAGKVADRLIQFSATGTTYSTLVQSAARARALDVAKSVGERGLASLPEAEKAQVKDTMKLVGAVK